MSRSLSASAPRGARLLGLGRLPLCGSAPRYCPKYPRKPAYDEERAALAVVWCSGPPQAAQGPLVEQSLTCGSQEGSGGPNAT